MRGSRLFARYASLALLCATVTALSPPVQQTLTDDERAERFHLWLSLTGQRSAEVVRMIGGSEAAVTGVPIRLFQPRWLSDGRRFWYPRPEGDGTRFMLVDPEQGTQTSLFDLRRLHSALADVSLDLGPGDAAPFPSIRLDGNAATAFFQLEQRQFRLDLGTYQITELDDPPGELGTVNERLASPDGSLEAWRRNDNLWVGSAYGRAERRLTADGGGTLRYWPESWSPDGRWLLYRSVSTAGLPEIDLLRWLTPTPEPFRFRRRARPDSGV